MLLLLPLLLIPFLLCCFPCCPCCASLLGGGGARGEKYVVLGGARGSSGYREESFIDDWYEQSKLYNNPAYVDEDWDSGSAHMLVNLDKGKAANGAAVGARSGQEVTEETEEYYRQNMSGGQGAAAAGAQGQSAEWDMTDGQMVAGKADTAQSAVIVDTLTPAAAAAEAEETVVLEEERRELRSEEDNRQTSQRMQPLLTTTDGDMQHMSSLSPATIDILDSASAYNAKVGSSSRLDKHGHKESYSHTATVPRYGNRYPPDSDEYITSQSYESDYHSSQEQRPTRSRYEQEEAGMTIVLDAQPTVGMQAENVEYEVLATNLPPPSRATRGGYSEEHTYRSGHSGTIPRNGFTIELEPSTIADTGMVAEREEYVLTDDEGLAPEFFTEAPRSPKQHKRYKKTTTSRTVMDKSNETDQY